MRPLRLIGRCLPALLLALVVAACEDELTNPEVRTCSETMTIEIAEPGNLNYLVAVDGNAVVRSVTYTTPGGDVTVDSPPDEGPNEILFQEEVAFEGAATAMLSVEGEVALGGQIGLSWTFIPEDAGSDVVNAQPVLCTF